STWRSSVAHSIPPTWCHRSSGESRYHAVLQQIKANILQQTFGGAPTYITYLTAGVICLILVFNMAFGGIDLVLDRQLGFLSTLLTAPIPRASIYFSGVLQNLAKVMFLALLTFGVALIIPNGLILPPT